MDGTKGGSALAAWRLRLRLLECWLWQPDAAEAEFSAHCAWGADADVVKCSSQLDELDFLSSWESAGIMDKVLVPLGASGSEKDKD